MTAVSDSMTPIFTFNINDIPKGPVTYPPGSPPSQSSPSSSDVSPMDFDHEKEIPYAPTLEKAQSSVKSILKARSKASPYSGSGHRVKWSIKHTVRIVPGEDKPLDAIVAEGRASKLFQEYGAIDKSKPGSDDAPVSTWSRDPKDVKEVSKYRKYGFDKMDDEDLQKHYARLCAKQKNVFAAKRSQAFQDDIAYYIKKYSDEISRRRLGLLKA